MTDPPNGDAEIKDLSEKVEKLETEDDKHSFLIESTYDVEIQRNDPNSPLYSKVKDFKELKLPPELLKGVYDMNFKRPSKIQEAALPLLLEDSKNLIGQSQSGTGKTAAFVLAMLNTIDTELNAPQAVCVAPARELARQIMAVVRKMGKYTKVTTAEAIKDSWDRSTKLDAQLIVGTPGTLNDMRRKGCISFDSVKIFVLDEADSMLDQTGLGDQSIRLKNMMPKGAKIVLFSATYPDSVRKFAERFAPGANSFSLKREDLSVSTIQQFYMDCKDVEHKFQILDDIYSLLTVSQSIIFVERRDTADRIARQMTDQGHAVINLHGGLSSVERDHVMEAFRAGRAKVLIATNVISRGIDISQVTLVVNYDLPLSNRGTVPDYETYLHRIGRTGRFGRTGVAINFVHDRASWDHVMKISQYFKREITKVPTDDFTTIESILKKAIKAAMKREEEVKQAME